MTTQIKAGVIAANAVNSSELASGALSGQNFTGDVTFDTTTLKIDSSNNRVGIGTASPSVDLETLGSGGIKTGNASGTGLFKADGGSTKIGSFSNHRFDLITNNTVRASIDTSGNLGIGTTSPSSTKKLHVYSGDSGASDYGVPGLAIENDTNVSLQFMGGASHQLGITFSDSGVTEAGYIYYNTGTQDLKIKVEDDVIFQSGSTETMRIDSSGKVGIGETNPTHLLHLTSNVPTIKFTESDTSTDAYIQNTGGDLRFYADDGNSVSNTVIGFHIDASEKMRIDSSGNVGIGNSSPTRNLTVGDTASSSAINIKSSATNGYSILAFGDSGDDNYAQIFLDNSTSKVQIQNGGGGAIGNRGITLDSSENVGIGTSSPSTKLHVNGAIRLTDSTYSIYSSSASAVIGHIGNTANDLNIYSSTTGHNGLRFHVNGILPTDNTGTIIDGDANLGESNYRFKDIYLSGIVDLENAFRIRSESGQTGTLGFNRNPADGTHLGQSGLQRFQINGPFSGSDFLDFQNYNSSGTYTGGFRIVEGSIQGYPQVVSKPTYSFIGDSNTGMTRPTGDTLQFVTGGSEAMRINSGGDLLLGTTGAVYSGSERMSLKADGTGAGLGIQCITAASQCLGLFNSDSGGTRHFIRFAGGSGGPQVGSVTNVSSTTSYNTTSDYRLKENITYEFNALERLAELKPARFNFIADGTDRVVDGFIAHEVSDVVPEAVAGEKDAVKDDGTIDPQGMDASKLVPLLTKAIQEQQTIIDDLKSRIETLEG